MSHADLATSEVISAPPAPLRITDPKSSKGY